VPVSQGFRAFVLDQLSGVRALRTKPMFGCVGLYSGDVFFAVLADDVLYLRTDPASRPEFERIGGRPFVVPGERPMTMSYYSVPPALLEDAEELAVWARGAIAAKSGSTRRRSR
jgi:DNA transformation protein